MRSEGWTTAPECKYSHKCCRQMDKMTVSSQTVTLQKRVGECNNYTFERNYAMLQKHGTHDIMMRTHKKKLHNIK
jgi:hypothetical protein